MRIWQGMRDRLEKLAIMPFTIRSCSTPSSIAIKDQSSRSKQENPKSVQSATAKSKRSQVNFRNVASENSSLEGKKFLHKEKSPRPAAVEGSTIMFSKTQIFNTLQRLIKGVRSLSQLFVYKEEEMQIGYPTDVKHVAHIGWDGPSGTIKSWMGDLKGSSDDRRSSNFDQPRCSSWVDDPSTLPGLAARDLLGSLGLHPNNSNATRFDLFKAADAKAEGSRSIVSSTAKTNTAYSQA